MELKLRSAMDDMSDEEEEGIDQESNRRDRSNTFNRKSHPGQPPTPLLTNLKGFKDFHLKATARLSYL